MQRRRAIAIAARRDPASTGRTIAFTGMLLGLSALLLLLISP